MGELLKHHWQFNLVPEVAEQQFIEMVSEWYALLVEQKELPGIRNGMIIDGHVENLMFHDFLLELAEYEYSGKYATEFDSIEFPVDMFALGDAKVEQFNDIYISDFHLFEDRFYYDIEKYLSHNRMFYFNQYDKGSAVEYNNVPLKVVW